jgi:hypothetical protein
MYVRRDVPERLAILFHNACMAGEPLEVEDMVFWDRTVREARKWARKRNLGVSTSKKEQKLSFTRKREYNATAR